ncbi:MAG: alpha/beta fold hydrolase [Candidatus Hydrogenedentota bacterium]
MAFDISNEIYPYTGKFLDRDGLKYHYLDEGDGDPVVMVHGNPSWSIYYRNLVNALKDDYRCIVPDHIGCGLSDKPGDDKYDYTLESRVADLEALLNSLGIVDNITLVVHDWGGMIGMVYATRHPECIKRLVVLNTSAFHLPKSKPLPLGLWICRNTLLGTFLVRGFNAFSAGAAYVGCKRNPMSGDLKRAYCAPYNSWANRIATLRFVQDIPLHPGDKAYKLVTSVESNIDKLAKVPLLICWGLKDFVFDKHFLAEWEKHCPQAEIYRFEDCGHYILEDAQDEVIPLIETFMGKT